MPLDWKDIPGDSKEKYGLYLASREWGLKKRAIHQRANGKCERCKANPIDAVHHRTYVRKYREELSDLEGICKGCHDFTHGLSDHDPKPKHQATAGEFITYWSIEVPPERNGILETGFVDIDYAIGGGFKVGSFVIMASRPLHLMHKIMDAIFDNWDMAGIEITERPSRAVRASSFSFAWCHLGASVETREKFIPRILDLSGAGCCINHADLFMLGVHPHTVDGRHDKKDFQIWLSSNNGWPINQNVIEFDLRSLPRGIPEFAEPQ